MRSYLAVVHKDNDSSFGVYFPDLPGCFSAGETEDEAFENARIALRLYAEDQDALPEPRSVAALQRDEDVRKTLNEGAFVIGVPLVVGERKQRYNIMLDNALVSHVDDAARIAGLNRSEFVSQALVAKLKSTTGAVVLKPSAGRARAKRKASAKDRGSPTSRRAQPV